MYYLLNVSYCLVLHCGISKKKKKKTLKINLCFAKQQVDIKTNSSSILLFTIPFLLLSGLRRSRFKLSKSWGLWLNHVIVLVPEWPITKHQSCHVGEKQVAWPTVVLGNFPIKKLIVVGMKDRYTHLCMDKAQVQFKVPLFENTRCLTVS